MQFTYEHDKTLQKDYSNIFNDILTNVNDYDLLRLSIETLKILVERLNDDNEDFEIEMEQTALHKIILKLESKILNEFI
jgi:hypothetical protein